MADFYCCLWPPCYPGLPMPLARVMTSMKNLECLKSSRPVQLSVNRTEKQELGFGSHQVKKILALGFGTKRRWPLDRALPSAGFLIASNFVITGFPVDPQTGDDDRAGGAGIGQAPQSQCQREVGPKTQPPVRNPVESSMPNSCR